MKIVDERYENEKLDVPYNISNTLSGVGAEVFTLGYPLFLSGMGAEVKYSNGSISSKSGYKNDLNSYQTTVAIQPGNSGSPLFDKEGNVVGCINAAILKADNVSYAVKSTALLNLLMSSPDKVNYSEKLDVLAKLSREEQIKVLAKYVAVVTLKR